MLVFELDSISHKLEAIQQDSDVTGDSSVQPALKEVCQSIWVPV